MSNTPNNPNITSANPIEVSGMSRNARNHFWDFQVFQSENKDYWLQNPIIKGFWDLQLKRTQKSWNPETLCPPKQIDLRDKKSSDQNFFSNRFLMAQSHQKKLSGTSKEPACHGRAPVLFFGQKSSGQLCSRFPGRVTWKYQTVTGTTSNSFPWS